jgi:hypothetical protein
MHALNSYWSAFADHPMRNEAANFNIYAVGRPLKYRGLRLNDAGSPYGYYEVLKGNWH